MDTPRQTKSNVTLAGALFASAGLPLAISRAEYDELLKATARELNAAEITWIPVHGINVTGNSDEAYKLSKRPSVKTWTEFQARRSSVQEQQAQFDSGIVGGIAIVTGGESPLFFIDIDPKKDPDAYEKFARELPDLASAPTYRETTPSLGVHILLRKPPTVQKVETVKSSIGEIRGEGAITDIAPTITPRGEYAVEAGDFTTIYTVNEEQYHRMVEVFKAHPEKRANQPRPQLQAHELITDLQYHELDAEIIARLGVTEYGKDGFSNAVLCPLHDDHEPSAYWHRNGFLYCHAGCTSQGFRRAGCNSRIDTAQALGINLKATTTPPIHASSIQALLQRYPGKAGGEGIATVLLCVLPTLDSSRITDSDRIKAATEGAKIVGRRVREKALDTFFSLGIIRVHIEQVSNAERGASDLANNTLLRDTCAKSTRIPKRRGPRPILYEVATAHEIAAILGVKPQGVINIKPAELKTRKLTDILIERHIEAREDRKVSYKQIGADYGKSRSTAWRHIVANARIKREPTFNIQVPITSVEQLEHLMSEIMKPLDGLSETEKAKVMQANEKRRYHSGRYLESSKTGRRYPPTSAAAQYLLDRKETPILFERGLNRLSINKHVTPAEAAQERAIYRLKDRAYRIVRRVFAGKPEEKEAQRYLIQSAFKQRNRAQLEQVISDTRNAAKFGLWVIRPTRGKCRSCGHYTPPGMDLCVDCAVAALPIAAGDEGANYPSWYTEDEPHPEDAAKQYETIENSPVGVSLSNPFSKEKLK